MVNGRARFFCLLLGLLLLAACAAAPQVERRIGFSPVAGEKVLYVVPFLTVMTPTEIEEGIFDLFVDALNDSGQFFGYEFVILKQGIAAIDPAWLARQHYVTGEVFGYVEESGCCSTDIRLKSRIRLHQPGQEQATLQIDYPRQIFFEHDYSTIEEERRKLAEEISVALAERLLAALSPP